jgi:glycerol-3-phosphate dehydrogenase
MKHTKNRYSDNSNRAQFLRSINQTAFDLIVIGGGITGAGITLDASSRGLSVLLLEQKDFAFGTSSRSTKLIHGGLRYLKQLEFALVAQVGRERAVVHQLAPHLVIPEKLLMPLVKGGSYGRFGTSIGLKVYDIIADVKKEDRRVMLSAQEAKEMEPLLDVNDLEGGGYYAEYRTDDARLTMEIIKKAIEFGAVCLNYAEVVEFEYQDQKICGVKVNDHILDDSFVFQANYVVSACGPWVDQVRSKVGPLGEKKLHLTKGVHLVLDYNKLPIQQSLYFDIPDGRMIFAIPRGRITYVGTTDTTYIGDKGKVRAEEADVNYLINAINATFPTVNLSLDDVESTWAGLRPLIHQEGKSPSELSRKDEIFESESGLISIAGGKLTGYRKMAEKIVDLIAKKIKKERSIELKECFTNEIKLCKDGFNNYEEVEAYTESLIEKLKVTKLNAQNANYLVYNYGKGVEEILTKIDASFDEAKLIVEELKYSLDRELLYSSSDYFNRRSGRLYFNIHSVLEHKDLVHEYLSNHFSWNESQQQKDSLQLEEEINNVLHFKNVGIA